MVGLAALGTVLLVRFSIDSSTSASSLSVVVLFGVFSRYRYVCRWWSDANRIV